MPDVNLLVYAYNADAPLHEPARAWWENALSSTRAVGIAWVALLGFVRLMSNARVLDEPMSPAEALGECRRWLARPSARVLVPGVEHADVLAGLLDVAGHTRLVTEAHLAALAIEHRAELHSNDADFARFPGLNWHNPLGDYRQVHDSAG